MLSTLIALWLPGTQVVVDMRSSLSLVLALIGFLLLALVACGGDDSGTPAGQAAPTATTAPTAAQQVQQVQVVLSPDKSANPVGTKHTVIATVTVDGRPLANATVTFTILTGPHAPQSGTATTNVKGEATFTYPGTAVGVDTIQATVAVEGAKWTSNSVFKEWKDETPQPSKVSYVYPVKFVCGTIPVDALDTQKPPSEPPVKPGNYATAVNLYNFQVQDVKFSKKAVIANPQGQPSGASSRVLTERLGAGLALEVDCSDITRMLSRAVESPLPAFIKGFVVIESPAELQVVGVYTVRGAERQAAACTAPAIILNTGFDQSILPIGSLIADGQPDDDWDMINAPQTVPIGNAEVADPFPFGGPPLSNSQWISLSDGSLGTGSAASEVTYQFQFEVSPGCTAATLSFDYLIQQSFGDPRSTATWTLNGAQIAKPGGHHQNPTHVETAACTTLPTGTNTLTVVIGAIAAVAPGLDVAGAVTFCDSGGTVGETTPNTSIDVEYVQPKVVKRVVDNHDEQGRIIVEKITEGVTSAVFGFDFCCPSDPFKLTGGDSQVFGPLATGTYGVKEVTLPPGWSLASATCDDGSDPSAIALGPGETVTCRFVNTKRMDGEKPDLSIEKSQKGEFPFGGTGTYVITVKNSPNAGPASQPIPVVETLPFGFTFSPGSENSPWACTVTSPVANPATDQETVACTYPGTLAPGDSLTLIIQVNVNPITARPPGPNCAEVRHPDDTNPANNESCVPTVFGSAVTPTLLTDLALDKFANLPFQYGQQASYTIQVQNQGSGTVASPITVVDVLPDGLTYLSFTDPYSSDWSCSAAGQTVTCIYSGSDIAPTGVLPTLMINVQIATVEDFPAGGDQVENCATVRYDSDVDPGNDQGCVSTIVTTPGAAGG